MEYGFEEIDRVIVTRVEALEHRLDQKIGQLDRKVGELGQKVDRNVSKNGYKSLYSYFC